jgi:hypothetical protein
MTTSSQSPIEPIDIRALAEGVAGLTPDVAGDNAALHGRLAKDRALALTSDALRRAAAIAAHLA